MRVLFIRLTLALFTLGAFFETNRAYSCSCKLAPLPLKEKARVAAVFTGKVLMLKKVLMPDADFEHEKVPMIAATLSVDKSFKGILHRKVVVLTGFGSEDCGYSFVKGKSYLVYAFKDEKGALNTDICERTQPLESATNEILELEGRLPILKLVVIWTARVNESLYDGYRWLLGKGY